MIPNIIIQTWYCALFVVGSFTRIWFIKEGRLPKLRFLLKNRGLVTAWATLGWGQWGGVRLALLALSVFLAFAQAVVDNANNTSLAPLIHQM